MQRSSPKLRLTQDNKEHSQTNHHWVSKYQITNKKTLVLEKDKRVEREATCSTDTQERTKAEAGAGKLVAGRKISNHPYHKKQNREI